MCSGEATSIKNQYIPYTHFVDSKEGKLQINLYVIAASPLASSGFAAIGD